MKSIELLEKHLHLLSPEKRAVARYVCDHWPLDHRLPQGVAALASRTYGRPVHDVASAQALARELFLEVAQLARTP